MEDKIIVLYVDDELINLKLFEINLGKRCNVLTADNGKRGLELLDMFPEIKVIISDMRMPYMSGIEFIRIAKAKFPEKSFFILTGYEITEEIQQAIDAGLIKQYFCKPINMFEILGVIEQTIINATEQDFTARQ